MLQENVRAKRDGEDPTNFTQASWDAMPDDKYGYKLYIVKDELPLLAATKTAAIDANISNTQDAVTPINLDVAVATPQLQDVKPKKVTTKKVKK